MPKLSLILPCYNVDKYLEKCLDSLINQTEKDIEILFVDQGSTDNTLKFIKKYSAKDKRIRILQISGQLSDPEARKTGLENASGKYIWFINPDDYIEKDACETLYQEAENEKLEVLCFNARNYISKDVYGKINNLDFIISIINWPVNEIINVQKISAGLSDQIPMVSWIFIAEKSFLENKLNDKRYFEDSVLSLILFSQCTRFKAITYTAYHNVIKQDDIKNNVSKKDILSELNNLLVIKDFIILNNLHKNHFVSRILNVRYKAFNKMINDYNRQNNDTYKFSDEQIKKLSEIKHKAKRNKIVFVIKNLMPLGIFKLVKFYKNREKIYLLRK
ncbi:MAG: glycosyltransferase family 2 protein [Treponema sp.]|nr:glycosyltransferase family 2 protein [Treponema sp.]